MDNGDFDTAIINYRKSLEQFDKQKYIDNKHLRGVTLANIGKLYLDKKPLEPEEALKYLEESIKIIDKEIRPDYPNTIILLALCYHRLGNKKKTDAKREKDFKNKKNYVDLSSELFSKASEYYNELLSLPRVIIPISMQMYSYIDKGHSLSVRDIIESDDYKAINLLDNALILLKKALNFADEKEKIKLNGVISDHEAKKYIRLAAIEKNPDKQNLILDKAIEALLNAASDFERLGDACSNTCQGCSHLFLGLRYYRKGIRDKDNKALSDSVFELIEAQKCYEKAENELGKDTVEVLGRSFKLIEEQIKSRKKIIVTKIAPEFNAIIEELSAVGLRKMVKMYTFDEGMNVKKEESGEGKGNVRIEISGQTRDINVITNTNGDIGKAPEKEKEKSESLIDLIANPATLASFIGWGAGAMLMDYNYQDYGIISVVIGCVAFVFFVIPKLRTKSFFKKATETQETQATLPKFRNINK